MDEFINAMKQQDLVACKKAFDIVMADKLAVAIEDRRSEIIQSVKIDGEEDIDTEEKDEE